MKLPNDNNLNGQAGFAALLSVILVLIVAFSIVVGVTILVLNEQKMARNIVQSKQAYYAAEGGIEDGLLRIAENLNLPELYIFSVGGGTAQVSVTKTADSRIVKSTGQVDNITRKVEAAGAIATAANFYYGVQVGAGGLTIDANSQVIGNVYSNGIITGESNVYIQGDAVSAGPLGAISKVYIQKSSPTSTDGNAWAHSITNSTIDGNAYGYNLSLITVGGNVDADVISDCTVGGMPILIL